MECTIVINIDTLLDSGVSSEVGFEGAGSVTYR
jgi:hypothetical protein